ncbi:tyrosine-protein phosphatase [Clostridium vincentii]|uniref:protein-tyrosine-phosphatase n=1 Tax=Clostridium vincentii TaxID=52704 RepID=A0A2T0BD60_9CLOT|nr:CpsB/CapC family capsule biosynthesis tyrosine phosphatase [Clostridium vincentii]PRR81772.1 Tyrosine-protein phosphatase YwqE [Clostridium vincentii]
MIDIHSHILPGIDDGSKDIGMSLDMLRNAVMDGTTEIVATPHFCRGYGETTYEEVKKIVNDFNVLIKSENINIDIHYGQEVYYSESIIEDYKSGLIGCINDSRYLLFELPMKRFDKETFDILYELQMMDIVPVLAHPERYRPIIDKPSYINKFTQEGILLQMNSGSIKGSFGAEVKKTANILLEHGIYNFIGSDAHNNGNRCTGISEGIEISTKKNKIYRKVFKDSAKKLIKNIEIGFSGEKIKEKKGFFFFK